MIKEAQTYKKKKKTPNFISDFFEKLFNGSRHHFHFKSWDNHFKS